MSKKVQHIVISILLLVATTGFTSFRHYCGEELISKSIMSDQAGCCDESSACCHDEAQTYHIDGDFFSVFYDYSFGQFPISLSGFFGYTEISLFQSTVPFAFKEGAPSLDSKKAPSHLQVFIL